MKAVHFIIFITLLDVVVYIGFWLFCLVTGRTKPQLAVLLVVLALSMVLAIFSIAISPFVDEWLN